MPSVQFAAAAGRDIDSVSTWGAENRARLLRCLIASWFSPSRESPIIPRSEQ